MRFMLARLYCLHPSEYLVIEDRDTSSRQFALKLREAQKLNLIHLYPRYDVNYKINA